MTEDGVLAAHGCEHCSRNLSCVSTLLLVCAVLGRKSNRSALYYLSNRIEVGERGCNDKFDVSRDLCGTCNNSLCVGENLEEREAGKHFDVCKAQTVNVLSHFTAEDMKHIVIDYEPVWANGTGKTGTSAQAEEIHAFIRETLAGLFGAEVAEETTILYGGSCKPSNAKELFAQKDTDGGLIGGAALKAEDFIGIALSF